MAKGKSIKTDGPMFTAALCAVLVRLDDMYRQSITQEHGLIKRRDAAKQDLRKFNREDMNRKPYSVAHSDAIMDIEDCRKQRGAISERISEALSFGAQPSLQQEADEEKILALVEGAEQIQEKLDLWKASEEAAVGAGPVGEPGERTPDASVPHAHGVAPDGSGGPMILRKTPVEVVSRKGKAVATGEFDSYVVKDAKYQVLVAGELQEYSFKAHTVRPVAAPDIPLDTRVRVTRKCDGEVAGEGSLESQDREASHVRMPSGRIRFDHDIYAIDPVAPAKADVVGKIEGGQASGRSLVPPKADDAEQSKQTKKRGRSKAAV